jgi:hypothetical protein
MKPAVRCGTETAARGSGAPSPSQSAAAAAVAGRSAGRSDDAARLAGELFGPTSERDDEDRGAQGAQVKLGNSQVPLQHSVPTIQPSPPALQSGGLHAPSVQAPLQQSSGTSQRPPSATHPHAPAPQTALQHSSPSMHGVPSMLQPAPVVLVGPVVACADPEAALDATFDELVLVDVADVPLVPDVPVTEDVGAAPPEPPSPPVLEKMSSASAEHPEPKSTTTTDALAAKRDMTRS